MSPLSPAPLVRAADTVVEVFEGLPDALRAIVERSGVVFDKWPPPDDQMPPWGKEGREPWTPERLAALDPEVRWQGIAFSLYTEWVIGPLSHAIDELKEAALPAGSGAGELDAETLLATLRDRFHEARAGTPEWRDGIRLGLEIAMNEVSYWRERAATGSDAE